MSWTSKVEVILFVASKPLSYKRIADALAISTEDALKALRDLQQQKYTSTSGVQLMVAGDEWQLVAAPDERVIAERFMKAEVSGDLTKPQLETLTVVAYCGPITRPELEQIRGVNCALIIRNLQMRGLIKETDDTTALVPAYVVTVDYLRALGLRSVEELPQYAELHRHDYVKRALEHGDMHETAPSK